ncbi:triose-phosphate transporter family-domain-containing protein [Aspergillus stella-maris]|uniref:triose-phosphate transporter family-domain-containing protein n=1 Tax=Aspergillus stella-maris TaxID=1810926 RepID=UPI003CCE12C8
MYAKSTNSGPSEKGKGVWGIVFCTLNWIFWSNLTILFNKWILESTPFRYPILLTTWHLTFATICTQFLSRICPSTFTSPKSDPNSIKMTPTLYITKIAPIALLYSGSLVCSNMAYVYLNVGFVQMLKASGPVITLLTGYLYGVTSLTTSKLINVGVIAASVALTVVSEIRFSWVGVAVQILSLVCDALRLVLLEVLTGSGGKGKKEKARREVDEEASSSLAERERLSLSLSLSYEDKNSMRTESDSDSARLGLIEKDCFDEHADDDENSHSQTFNKRENQNLGLAKMDPLLSLYYTAPICALLNGVLAWRAEVYPLLHSSSPSQAETASSSSSGGSGSGSGSLMGIILETGVGVLLLNAIVGFMLNVAVFTLIGKTSGLTMTLVSIPKNILLILASVVLFGTQVSLLQGVGYAGALVGLVVYAGGGSYVSGLLTGFKRRIGLERRGRYERLDSEGRKKESVF